MPRAKQNSNLDGVWPVPSMAGPLPPAPGAGFLLRQPKTALAFLADLPQLSHTELFVSIKHVLKVIRVFVCSLEKNLKTQEKKITYNASF